MATGGVLSRSESRNGRPRMIGTPKARKYSGPATSSGVVGFAWVSDAGWPSASHVSAHMADPTNGTNIIGDTAVTLGIAFRSATTLYTDARYARPVSDGATIRLTTVT